MLDASDQEFELRLGIDGRHLEDGLIEVMIDDDSEVE